MILISKHRAIYNKLSKLCKNYKEPHCPICNKPITTENRNEVDYIKTKRGTEIFIHTECVKEWSK